MTAIAETAAQSEREAARRPGVAASNARRLTGLLICLAVLLVTVLASIAVGSRDIALPTVIDALFAYDDSNDHAIVLTLRLPRTILGLLIGAALGISGALIQALTRNPLADPGILGVNAGASFFVLIAVGYLGMTSLQSYIWFAFLGAIITTVMVYAVGSTGRNGATPVTLTLAGVAIGAILGGVSTALTLLNPAAFDRMRFWAAGALSGGSYEAVTTVAPFLIVGLLLAALMARPLNAVALGDDLAKSLGANIVRVRTVVVIAVTLLAGGATAAAGPIGFVGLMVPHVARWIVGPDQRWIMAYTVVLAPVLLLISDIIGRIVMRPGEIQVAIVTAFIGAPVLILLVRRRKVSGL